MVMKGARQAWQRGMEKWGNTEAPRLHVTKVQTVTVTKANTEIRNKM